MHEALDLPWSIAVPVRRYPQNNQIRKYETYHEEFFDKSDFYLERPKAANVCYTIFKMENWEKT